MNFGLPYKGSKSRIAVELCSKLPSAEHFYDLFVGSGAVAHRVIFENRWKHVHINDINPLIPNLFIDAVNGKYHEESRWVGREEFLQKKEADGYVAVMWSFGNNLRNYMYNEEVEPLKKAMHFAICGEWDAMNKYGIDLSSIKDIPSRYHRRIKAQNIIKRSLEKPVGFVADNFELVQRLVVCESLERQERLQQLERLHRFKDKITKSSVDYRDVKIQPNSVIYCDIPYANTDGYVTDFDHDAFYDWASLWENIYISSYWMPEDRFECIAEFKNRSTYSKDSNATQATERLFIPRGNHHIKTTLF